MRLRLSDYGAILVLTPAIVLFGAWCVNSIHNQGANSAQLMENASNKDLYLKEVKQDLENKVNWNIELSVSDGKKVGDLIEVPKPGTLGPRTVKSIPLPGKTKSPDQVFRVDQNTGRILEIFSNEQVKKKGLE